MRPDLPKWPDSLPWHPFGDTPPKYTPQSAVVRSDNETGPAKVRRRFTARVHDIPIGPLVLTRQQCATLEDFCCGMLGEVLPFEWIDFRTELPAAYRLKNGWASVTQEWYGRDTATGTDYWSVTLELEMLSG